jgi:ABC-type cobalamin/Fe3+-siderophores transport system ATPase subunit
MLLKLHNVYAGYDGGDILKEVSLEVEQGTTTCIVGPNGAGKSTILRVISGLEGVSSPLTDGVNLVFGRVR